MAFNNQVTYIWTNYYCDIARWHVIRVAARQLGSLTFTKSADASSAINPTKLIA